MSGDSTIQRSGTTVTSDYTPDTERRVEQLLSELYAVLQIQKPVDLFGSVLIEMRYQAGRPVGQVDVQVKYVMKRSGNNRIKLNTVSRNNPQTHSQNST
jgi:hypothetical protein